jgi:hypothetical protein
MNHHDIEMTSQLQAKSTAKSMIKNVSKPRARYREVKDLLRFFKKTDVAFIFPQLEGAMDTGKIKKSALNSGECLSRKEGTGPFHLINCPKLQMQLSSHHNYGHFSCSLDFHNGPFFLFWGFS